MKVSIPCMGDEGKEEDISPHFGRAPAFAMYDTESEDLEMIDNTSEHMGGSMKPPELMDKHEVSVMITSNLGRKAISMFDRLGIEVYCGASGTVEDALEQWRNDELDEANETNACKEGH